MALVWKDRVLETTTTEGTGAITLAGAVTGYQTFAAIGDGNSAYYCIYAVDGFGNPSGAWEVGLGTYTASGTTLARTAVYANSSGTQVALDLAAGTKRVMLTAAAQHLTTIPVVNGGTGLTALGSALQVLRVNSGGTALEYGTISTGLTVGSTAITSGTSGRLLYDAAGTLGETAAVTYSTSTANLTVTASGAAVVPFVAKGATSQSANLLECQNSSAATVGSFGPTGALKLNEADTYAGSDGVLRIQGSSVGYGVRLYRGSINFDLQNDGNLPYIGSASNHAFVFMTNNTGRLWMQSSGAILVAGSNAVPAGQLEVVAGSASTVGFVVRGATSQTAVLCQLWGVSSTANRQQADIDTAWADSTDATRKARLVLRAWDTAARECIRLEASGSAPMLGLYGTAATVQYATTGTVTGYTGGGGTALTHSDTFTGNTGATAYTLGDIVRALKLLGVIAA